MKKDRRQELQTNILADRLGKAISVVRPYFTIALSVLGVAILAFAFVAWKTSREQNRKAELWEAFLAISVENPQASGGQWSAELDRLFSMVADLEALASNHPGEAGAAWVKAAAGNALLSAGMRQLYNDKAQARSTLRRAKGVFEDLILELSGTDIGRNTDLLERVQFSFGQTSEALSAVPSKLELHDHHLQKAKSTYADLSKNSSSSGIRLLADYRLRILGPIAGKQWTGDGEPPVRADWSSWLAQQEFPQDLPPIPGPTNGSNLFPQPPPGSNIPNLGPPQGAPSDQTTEPVPAKTETEGKTETDPPAETPEKKQSETDPTSKLDKEKSDPGGASPKASPAKSPDAPTPGNK